MASFLTKQFLFSGNPLLTFIEGSFQVGGTGAVVANSTIGIYVSKVTRLYVGTYQIQLATNGNFNRLVGASFSGIAGVTSSSVNMNALVANTTYQITTVGNATVANWVTVGVNSGVVPAVGVTFVASNTVANTSAAAKAVGTVGWDHVELMGNPNTMLAPNPSGALINFQTVLAGSVADPTNGSALRFNLFLRNSSLLAPGETASNY